MVTDPQTLFDQHTDWAKTQAIRYSASAGVPFDSIENAALLGLWQAAQRWAPNSKAVFKTFARYRIRGEILDQARSMDCVPRRANAVKLGHEIPKIVPIGEHMGSTCCAQSIPDTCETDETVELILAMLKGRSRTVVVLYFFKNMTILAIAKRLGISENRVQSIKRQALQSLRTRLTAPTILRGGFTQNKKAAN